MADKTVLFKIKRQATPDAKPHWEEFELPWHPGMNVISSLMEIAAQPSDPRRQGHHADYLRLELPGRGLRLLRHADQRPGAHGLLGPGGQTGTSQSSWSRSPNFLSFVTWRSTAACCLKI